MASVILALLGMAGATALTILPEFKMHQPEINRNGDTTLSREAVLSIATAGRHVMFDPVPVELLRRVGGIHPQRAPVTPRYSGAIDNEFVVTDAFRKAYARLQAQAINFYDIGTSNQDWLDDPILVPDLTGPSTIVHFTPDTRTVPTTYIPQ